MSRKMTEKLLQAIEAGLLDRDTVIMACVKYMSEDDVADMCHANEFRLENEDENEDEDEDEDESKDWNEFVEACGHMQPYVEHGQYFEVETSHGTEIVPADAIGRTVGTAAEAFANYCEGSILDNDACCECKTGWLARMSAPGYMDCTDWTAHETEQDAQQYLVDNYGD